jgi:hypothetical protein
MNIIPRASQNTDAITLPADRCVFLRFGFGRSVHSADCRLYFMYLTKSKSSYFDEEVKAYKSLECYKYYKSKYDREMYVKSFGRVRLIMGIVQRELRGDLVSS